MMISASTNALLWVLVGIAGASHLATGLFHDVGPPAVQAAILVVSLVLFAFAHGSVVYGFRDVLVFAAICLVVTNLIENISVLTGYPAGSYHYTERLGPRLFLVPLVIGPAYFGVGYLAWMLARLMLRDIEQPRSGRGDFDVPLIASFLMVAWDLSFDPLASTVRQGWIWEQGGSYFGAPVTNFFSWCLTSYLFFQIYALYGRYVARNKTCRKPATRQYWCQAVVLYATIAGMLMLLGLTTATTETVTDQAGVLWRVQDIYTACAIVCTFTMGAFTVLALLNLARLNINSQVARPAT
jgi:uncharacterized membrane protein